MKRVIFVIVHEGYAHSAYAEESEANKVKDCLGWGYKVDAIDFYQLSTEEK